MSRENEVTLPPSWRAGDRSEKRAHYITTESFAIKLPFHTYTVFILFVKKNIFDNVINMIVKCLIHLLMSGFYFCKAPFSLQFNFWF